MWSVVAMIRLGVALVCIALGVQANEADGRRSRCNQIRETYEKRGYLAPPQRVEYCVEGCDFISAPVCVRKELKTEWHFDAFGVIKDKLKQIITAGEGHIALDAEGIDAALYDIWWKLAHNGFPMLLAFVPILLNQWKQYKLWSASALFMVFIGFHLTGLVSAVLSLHNIIVALLCWMQPASSTSLGESIVAILAANVVIAGGFFAGNGMQIFVLIAAIVGYVAYLRWAFFVRKQGSGASVILVIIQVIVFNNQLEYARDEFLMNSIVSVVLEMMMNAMLPSGRSSYFTKNSMISSLKIVKFVGYGDGVVVFCVVFLTQLVLLLAFRASLGTYYILTLRYKMDITSIFYGLIVYMTDAFGPFVALYRLVFRYEAASSRRLLYALTGIILSYVEVRGALELMQFRLIVSFIDYFFVQSTFGRTLHYLEYNVDFMQSQFPQVGAPPWLSFKKLAEVAKHTGVVFAKRDDGQYVRGMGVALRSGGSIMFYTVQHVARRAIELTFQGKRYSSPDLRPVTDGDDPIVGMKAPLLPGVPDVEILTIGELPFIKQVMFVNSILDKNGDEVDKTICFVDDWTLDKNGTKMAAAVNLRKGDSGGPVFAILSSGSVRFCGVVSQGNPRDGGGNLISFFTSDKAVGYNSSDDESPVEKESKIAQFNGVRRNALLRGKPSGDLRERADDLERFLDLNEEVWEISCALGVPYTWVSCGDYASTFSLWKQKFDNSICEDEDGGDAADGDEVNPDFKEHKKKDKRARYKDRAMRKRQCERIGPICALLRSKLQSIYNDNDARNIYDRITRGQKVPELDGGVIEHWEEGLMIVDDDGDLE